MIRYWVEKVTNGSPITSIPISRQTGGMAARIIT
jgi:hypothetical protein